MRAAVPEASTPGPMVPVVHRVVGHRRETKDVATISLLPLTGPTLRFTAGQFNMLTAFGVGEAAVSLSGTPGEDGPLHHTVRDVGPVTHALCQLEVGDVVGVRGPFGTDWQVGSREDGDGDTVVVAGGIGLAPLRGAIDLLAARAQASRRRVFVLVGARDPSQIVFGPDLERWTAVGAHVAVTVDAPTARWAGNVGVVTSLLPRAGFDAPRTRALVCGPEIMMRMTARALVELGVDPRHILVSLERNMQCALAWCGHCQLGPLLLCRDGPVVTYAGIVSTLLTERER